MLGVERACGGRMNVANRGGAMAGMIDADHPGEIAERG